jgi:hypothetical protein
VAPKASCVIAPAPVSAAALMQAPPTQVPPGHEGGPIAYSLILKNVGVLYDTMYLAATAMGLAPCALGCSNADAFARAARTDYYAETSVGEFLLGSRPA